MLKKNFGKLYGIVYICFMENLIKIKSENGIQLTDRELSVRWWGRLSIQEKRDILKEHLPSHNIGIMDYESVYWVWLKQQKL